MPTKKRVKKSVTVKKTASKKTNSVKKQKKAKNIDIAIEDIVVVKEFVVEESIELVAEVASEDGFDLSYDALAASIGSDETSSSSFFDEFDETKEKKSRPDSKTVFDVKNIDDPLVGTPTEVRKELDSLAMRMQRNPKDQEAFLKIVCYMHKYILGLVFRKYSFVRGHDDKDIYQEALIALFKKAVPSFKKGKGMSFLNFAKMCINRHLITILNSSRNRRKDIPLNTSISLDHTPAGHDEDDESCLLSNVIPDKKNGKPPYSEMAKSESFERTFSAINAVLSEFERAVLEEYLKDKSYRDASRAVSKRYGRRCNERSIDNALLRIRKKAMAIKSELGEDALPLIFGLNDI
jgi:RNA polymerase sporulation-specific sigma factor